MQTPVWQVSVWVQRRVVAGCPRGIRVRAGAVADRTFPRRGTDRWPDRPQVAAGHTPVWQVSVWVQASASLAGRSIGGVRVRAGAVRMDRTSPRRGTDRWQHRPQGCRPCKRPSGRCRSACRRRVVAGRSVRGVRVRQVAGRWDRIFPQRGTDRWPHRPQACARANTVWQVRSACRRPSHCRRTIRGVRVRAGAGRGSHFQRRGTDRWARRLPG